MPNQVKNKTLYLAINLAETPEDRGLALKILRQFGDGQAPEDFDYGDLADKITENADWIIKHPEGMVTFVDQETYEREFEQA